MEEIKIEEISFPVKEEKIYIKLGENYKAAGSHKAIINSDNNTLISVVSNSYKVISNNNALEYGKKCMKELFELKNENDITVFNIVTPKTFSFCHVDLVCKNEAMKIIKDNFTPFVRVTNSYNTSYKLSFSVGFCRSICKNGVIFDQSSIEFEFSHLKSVIKEEINFKVKKNEFEKLKNEFIQDLQYLSKNKIDDRYLFALFCKALNIKFNLNGSSTELQKKLANEKLDKYRSYFYKKYNEYSNELGENLYSLYNVITDFSSNSDEINTVFTNTFNSNQRRAGQWLLDFTVKNKSGLNIEDYLKEYLYLKRN